MLVQVVESADEPNTQYLQIAETEDVQGTESAVSVLQNIRFNTQNGLYQDFETRLEDIQRNGQLSSFCFVGVVSATASDRLDPASVNILQQIIELGTESPDTVASVVAMAPGTVTVVEQASLLAAEFFSNE